MLDFIRKKAKTWALRFLLFIVAATFAFWGVGGFISEDRSAVITVDGAKIAYADYQKTFNRLVDSYRTVLGRGLDNKTITDLKIRENAVDYLLERALLVKTADDLALTVSGVEVQEFIRREPGFSDRGIYSPQRYRDYLAANRLNQDSFEAGLANDMTLAKVRGLLQATAAVSPQELDELLEMSARKVQVEVARVDPDRFVRLVPPPAADEIAVWYDEHREDYRRPESFSAVFAVIDPASFRGKAVVTDDDLAELYEERRAEMAEPARFRFSRIFSAIPASAAAESVATIRARADALVADIRGGKTSFAAAARRSSEDRTSAAKGGAMGEAAASALDPSLVSALEAAEKGKVTDPVPTARGLEILLLESKTPARNLSLEEARARLTAEAAARAAAELANQAVNQLLSDTVKGKMALMEAAAKRGVPSFSPPAFTRKTPPSAPPVPSELLDDLYRAENREVGDVYESDGKLILFQMVERTDSFVPALAEIRPEVESSLLVKKALEMAGGEAERLAREVGPGLSFSAAAARVQARTTAPPPFSILERKVGDLPEGDSAAVVRAAFSIPRPGAAAAAPGKGAWYLVGLRAGPPADRAQKEALRAQVDKLLREQRAQEALKGWFEATREAMKDRIRINSEML